MKKEFLKVFVLFVALFVGVVKANAAISPYTGNCDEIDENKAKCNIIVEVTDTSKIKPGDNIRVNVSNPISIINDLVTINANTSGGWTVDSGSSKQVTITEGVQLKFVYNGTETLSNTNVTLGDGTYNKDPEGDECGFSFALLASACAIDNGRYFGLEGTEVTEDEYYKECYVCKEENGKYYGKDGKPTDEATYNKECKNICRIENGKYFCKDGQECTKEDYDNECPKNTNTGAFLPIAGIIAGVALIGVSTIMVRKQTKLRRL